MQAITSLLTPEEKWTAITPFQQLSYSVLAHVSLGALLFAISLTFSPRFGAQNTNIFIKFEGTSPPYQSGPRGAEPAAVETASSIPVLKIASVSNPLQATHDNLPRPVPLLSVNRTRPRGKIIPQEPACASNYSGPSVPNPRLECNPRVLFATSTSAKNQSLLVTSTSPSRSEESAGTEMIPASVPGTCGAGSPIVGSTNSEKPNVESPGGIIGEDPGPGRPGAIDTTLNDPVTPATPREAQLSTSFFGPYILPYSFRGGTQNVALDSFTELDQQAAALFAKGDMIAEKQPEEARKYWSETIRVMNFAVPLLCRDTGQSNKPMGYGLLKLAWCYSRLKEPDHASYYFGKAVGVFKEISNGSVEWATATIYYVDALIEEKRYFEAKEELLNNLPAYRRIYGENGKIITQIHERLASLSSFLERKESTTPSPNIDTPSNTGNSSSTLSKRMFY